MRHRSKWTPTLVSALAVLALPNLAMGVTYYVDAVTGTDMIGGLSNSCEIDLTPCKTITHAFTQVDAGTAGDPSVVDVAAGIYVSGELFPITLTEDYVSLVGASAATTVLDGTGTMATSALVVNAKGFSLSGFTFKNIGTALEISQGGYTVSNNIFEDSVGTGVYSSLLNPSESENFTVDPISLIDNIFTCEAGGTGVDLEVGLSFDGAGAPNLTAAIGDITVTSNTFTDCHEGINLDGLYIRYMDTGTATVGNITVTDNDFTDGYRGIEFNDLYVESMTDSIVTWGNINIDGNSFTHIEYGIEFSGRFGEFESDMVDTTINVGNVSVSGNTFTDNIETAIDIDYFDVSSLHGSSSAILGDLFVQNNTVEADAAAVSGSGIEIDDIGYIEYIYDDSTVTTGSVIISGNSVESSGYALYVRNYGVYYIGEEGGTDTASISFGQTSITDNPKLSSTNDYGLYLDIDYFGYDQYAQTKVDVGLITVDNNTITSAGSDGLYMYYYYESGYSMDDDATLDIAGLTFTDNQITSTDGYGAYFYLYELGYGMEGNSEISVGPTTISGNTIEAGSEALYFDFNEYLAYEMYDSSTFTMFPWTIDNNTLTTDDSPGYGALTIYYYDYYVGSYMEDDSSATLPDWIIGNNMIDVSGGYNGIYYHTYSNPDDNYGNAAVHYGSIRIDGNTFNKDKDDGMSRAIDFWIEDVCEDCYDSSTFSHGDITITTNTIYNAEDVGINVEYDEVGYAFDDDGEVTMGNVTIADNLIDTAPRGIYAGYSEIESEASAVVTLGTLDITGNTVRNITEDGIRFDISASIPVDDLLTATLNISQTSISDNTVTASAAPGIKSAGIWINGDIGDRVVFAVPEVSNNTVTGFNAGIGMDDLPEATISCNSVENSGQFGLFFLSDGDFTVVNNTFIDNGLGLKVEDSSTAAVMAEDNWWGDAAGPVACASCNGFDVGGGTVDYEPWLTSQPISLCGGSAFPWNIFMPAITGMKP